jgi:adenylate cyclase
MYHHMGMRRSNRTDNREIVKDSQKRIKKAVVEGFEYDHLVVAKSDHFLREHISKKLRFPVIYVDLVGSTMMSTELSPDFLSKIITVYSQEVAYVIEQFRGLVLKFVGDAVIGYFPFAIQKADEVVLCGESIISVVEYAINPLLLQIGYKGIEVKISADYGLHTIVRYGSDRVRSHVDLISSTMNLAAKMQAIVMGRQMVIGKSLYGKLSGDLQSIFDEAKLNDIMWKYRRGSMDRRPYRLFIRSF